MLNFTQLSMIIRKRENTKGFPISSFPVAIYFRETCVLNIETRKLIFTAKQLTGFYVRESNTGIQWLNVKRSRRTANHID